MRARSTQWRWPVTLATFVLGLWGCEKEIPKEAPPPPPIDVEALPGTFEGTFPCADCPGVVTTLWLRTDRVFFYRQRYLSATEAESRTYYAMGTWVTEDARQDLLLQGDGPTRRFLVHDPSKLEFRTSSKPAHLLERIDSSDFADIITVEGEYTPGRPQYFRECRTGLRYEIASTRIAARLQRQHRSMPRGQAVIAVLDARLNSTAEDTLWVAERIVSLKPGETC